MLRPFRTQQCLRRCVGSIGSNSPSRVAATTVPHLSKQPHDVWGSRLVAVDSRRQVACLCLLALQPQLQRQSYISLMMIKLEAAWLQGTLLSQLPIEGCLSKTGCDVFSVSMPVCLLQSPRGLQAFLSVLLWLSWVQTGRHAGCGIHKDTSVGRGENGIVS